MSKDKLKQLLDVMPVIAVGQDGKMTRVTVDNIDEIRSRYSPHHSLKEVYDIADQSLRNDGDSFLCETTDKRIFIVDVDSAKYYDNGNLKLATANEITAKDIDWESKMLADCGPDIRLELWSNGNVKKITPLENKKKVHKNKK